MSTEWTTVRNALVLRDRELPHRWYKAFGANVTDIELRSPIALQAANSLAAWKTTLVNSSTIADTPDIAGGAFLITSDTADNDGVNLHTISEPFTFASAWPFYFGVKLQSNDVTQSELWAGVGLADDDWNGGAPNDYVAFYKADAAATVNFQIAKDGAATSLESIATMVTSTDITLECYFDGTTFYAYVDGVLAGSIAATNANVPDDGEELAPTLEFTTGETNAATCTVKWLRAIQVQEP